MTDITRLLASLKRRSAHAKEFGDDITFVKLKDIDALVEALEKAQQQISKLEKKLTDRKRMNQEMAKAMLTPNDSDAAGLESRTVTVKLPEVQQPIDGTGYANAAGARYYKERVIKSLTAQGIKWEAE